MTHGHIDPKGCASPEQAALQARIRSHFATIPPPAELAERILVDAQTTRPESRSWASRRMLIGAACAALLAIFVLATGHRSDSPYPGSLASVLINELHTFSVSGRDLDVTATDPRVVQSWFQPRVEFNPPRPPQHSAGLALKSGRLCHILNQRVASYMYEHNGNVVSLYVLNTTARADIPNVASNYQRGHAHTAWRPDGLLYSLVGAVSLQDLQSVATSLRTALRS
jgi:anti-sigma factor RsiW